jgi:RNA polymerase sigma-B factor
VGYTAGSQTAGEPSSQRDDNHLLAVIRSRPAQDAARQEACEELVRRHAGIVRGCVARYRDTPEPAEDLMQVGYVGLMKAINGFDPAMGDSLGAYAQPCVSGEIKRYFRDKRWQMRVQRRAQELRLRIRAGTEELTQQLARRPAHAAQAAGRGGGTAAGGAGCGGPPTAELEAAQLASEVFQLASLDAPLAGEHDVTAGDLVGSEDPQIEHAVDIEAVWQHLSQLPARQQRLLMMRFYGNMSQAQIGEALGISQMHVSRQLTRALAYLREQLLSPG